MRGRNSSNWKEHLANERLSIKRLYEWRKNFCSLNDALSISPSIQIQSDFLDFYVSYLKELPDCLAVVTMLASSSVKSSAFVEVTQNETQIRENINIFL